MSSAKPVLFLSTPLTANFPKDVPRDVPSAISSRTPLSATSAFRDALPSAGLPSAGLPSAGLWTPIGGPLSAAIKQEEKTPITTPIAYMDFLRLASPVAAGKNPLNRTSTQSSATSNSSTSTVDSTVSEQDRPADESVPSTAASDETDCSCKCEQSHSNAAMKAAAGVRSSRVAPLKLTPLSPLAGPQYPLSAPASGLTFTGFNVPPSPAGSNLGGVASPRSPWSARSVHSPFDWDAALKARRYAEMPGPGITTPKTAGAVPQQPPLSAGGVAATSATKRGESSSKGSNRTSVRHIREVITRTVTYTPRVGPAPKGKRRKVDHETAVET